MMKSKRQAAANVFIAQNRDQFDDQVQEMLADYESLPAQKGLVGVDLAPEPAVMAKKKSERGLEREEVRQQRKKLPPKMPPVSSGFKTSEELQLEKEPIKVRETGFWFWLSSSCRSKRQKPRSIC